MLRHAECFCSFVDQVGRVWIEHDGSRLSIRFLLIRRPPGQEARIHVTSFLSLFFVVSSPPFLFFGPALSLAHEFSLQDFFEYCSFLRD